MTKSPTLWPDSPEGTPDIGPVRQFGQYTLVKRLATGGMAEIWLARQRGLAGFNRFVVIKKILSHLSEQDTFVTMFLDEARTSAQLNHPNIVQIFDLGREADAYYIAMEFIAGENLAAISWRGRKRKKPLSTAFAASIIAHACKALHYAHLLKGSDGQSLGIVHRDVSPQNILVTYEGEIKVVDFGIAKARSKSEQTKTGMLKGKFSYMSPEQCLGSPLDLRSDIFALGILLYELCTQKRLFKHESELMILEMITRREIMPPSSVVPDLAPELEDIIMRALEKDPKKRFQSAQELQLTLEQYLRTHRQAPSAAELASYMASLFTDNINEKNRLKEIASREDFERKYGDGSRSGAQPKRRVVHGRSPNEIHVTPVDRGRPAPGFSHTSSPGSQETAALDVSHTQSTNDVHAYSSTVEVATASRWGARIMLFVAILIFVGALPILYQQLAQETPAPIDTVDRDPARPVPSGRLTLDSVPEGARIAVNGNPMLLANGEAATTPSDLTSLEFGKAYHIRLSKLGYRPFEKTIILSKETSDEILVPKLEPYPGRITTRVTDPTKEGVRIWFDGKEVGSGIRLTKEVPGNTTVVITAKHPTERCTVRPARVRVEPNKNTVCEVTCNPRRRNRPRPDPTASSSQQRTRPATPTNPPPKPKGCVARPDLPPGFVTISTKPHSEIYLNGRKIGETPLPKVQLPSGCIKLTAVNQPTGKSKTVKVQVEPNRVRIYRFNLD